MSLTPETQQYFDWLDEQSMRRAGGFIIGVRPGRIAKSRGDRTEAGKAEYRSRFPRLERAQHLTAILGHIIEREDNE